MSPRDRLAALLSRWTTAIKAAVVLRAASRVLLIGISVLLSLFAVDWLLDLRPVTRIVLGSGVLLGIPTLVTWLCIIPVARKFHVSDVARAVERAYPSLDGCLITAVETPPGNPFHEPLATEAIRRIDFEPHLTPLKGKVLLKALALALAVCLLFGGWAVAFPAEFGVFARRLAGSSEGYPVTPALKLLMPQDLRVPMGSSLEVRAEVLEGFSFRSVFLETVGSETLLQPMRATEDGVWVIELSSVTEDLSLRASADGHFSAKTQVKAMPRPTIKSLRLHVSPPVYTGQLEYDLPEGQGNARIPEGSVLGLKSTSSAALSAAAILDVSSGEKRTLTISGNAVSASFAPVRSTRYTFELVDRDGIPSKDLPEFTIALIPDRPPAVNLVRPKANSRAIPGGGFRLAFKATDDYGLASARYRLACPSLTEGRIVEIPISPGSPSCEASFAVALDGIDLRPGEVLTVRLEILDNRPSPNTTSTDEISIRIVRPYEVLRDLRAFIDATKQTLERGLAVENNVAAKASDEQAQLREPAAEHRSLIRDLRRLADDVADASDEIRLGKLGDDEASMLEWVASGLRDACSQEGERVSEALLTAQTAKGAEGKIAREQAIENARKLASQMRSLLARLAAFESLPEAVRVLREIIDRQSEIEDMLKRMIEKEEGK